MAVWWTYKVDLVAGLDVVELVYLDAAQRLQRFLVVLWDELRQSLMTDKHCRPEAAQLADQLSTLLYTHDVR